MTRTYYDDFLDTTLKNSFFRNFKEVIFKNTAKIQSLGHLGVVLKQMMLKHDCRQWFLKTTPKMFIIKDFKDSF